MDFRCDDNDDDDDDDDVWMLLATNNNGKEEECVEDDDNRNDDDEAADDLENPFVTIVEVLVNEKSIVASCFIVPNFGCIMIILASLRVLLSFER